MEHDIPADFRVGAIQFMPETKTFIGDGSCFWTTALNRQKVKKNGYFRDKRYFVIFAWFLTRWERGVRGSS